jgi:hypothetical protein
MLHFLRKIRLSLIGSGSLRKYTFYAIGEIALVVIGILIALQINNWNENQKLFKESVKIKVGLQKDLKKDSLLLSKHIKEFNPLIEKIENLIFRYSQKDANLDTFKILLEEFRPTYNLIWSFNITTFQTIVSNGKLDLLDDPIKKAVLELNIAQLEILNKTTHHNWVDKMNTFTRSYKIIDFGDPGSYLNKIYWDIKDERDFIIQFTGVCSYKRSMLLVYQDGYRNILKNTIDLLKMLR